MLSICGYFITDFRKKLETIINKWEKTHELRPRVVYVSQKTFNRLNFELRNKGNLNGQIGWVIGKNGTKEVCLFRNTPIQIKQNMKYGEFKLQ